ncbi:Pre-mRNA-splicing factor prp5 (Complexed with cdc5 protein 1) (Pre-mRNA-processing protein 5) [Durusdinium trenchii]|uniref:Pre-mRNA-splicing factor prp5 (Complexed with cdc5 protein 1) (Pre-mRNA-processing protein 5) n=1 Tax=Durusdinium trenchii TaxID=1381693 RepID=A0ABP0SSM1_9DINO
MEARLEALVRARRELYGEGEVASGTRCATGREARIAGKVLGSYRDVHEIAAAAAERDEATRVTRKGQRAVAGRDAQGDAQVGKVVRALDPFQSRQDAQSDALVQVAGNGPTKRGTKRKNQRMIQLGAPELAQAESRALQVRRKVPELVRPKWHAPWKLMRVLPGHVGWVHCVAVDPSNEFFFTGSADRTIKVWDLASGTLKVTLTSHSHTVRGLATSERYPYLFSVSEDKSVKCWDLETNQVVRSYHGHLQGVTSVALHPSLDVLVSGGRDACARVWDIRTRKEVHLLGGHDDSVEALLTQPADPQVITGAMDKTIKLWDLAAGKCMTTLTNHRRGVRALAKHPREFSFASGSRDAIKKWESTSARLMLNLKPHNAIVHALAVNQRDVLFSGADDGSIKFFDWNSGHCFQELRTVPQSGSLDSEACVLAAAFDVTGSRLITCEADKSIKVWREDPDASEQSHPLNWDEEAETERLLTERF